MTLDSGAGHVDRNQPVDEITSTILIPRRARWMAVVFPFFMSCITSYIIKQELRIDTDEVHLGVMANALSCASLIDAIIPVPQ
jgi:hypothetical protein